MSIFTIFCLDQVYVNVEFIFYNGIYLQVSFKKSNIKSAFI